MPQSLSVIVPAYNESARLGKSLATIFAYLERNHPQSEVLVVDDGSTDDTVEVAERSFIDCQGVDARVIRVQPNRGKGNAVRAGMLAARAQIALFTDADLSTPIEETSKLVDAIEQEGVDLAFGSRGLDRNLIGVHQSWRREQGGRFFNLVVRMATGLPYWDTQCGFKAFRMDVFRPLAEVTRIDRFGFDVELLYVANLAGLKLKEIAVRWDHNDGSKLNVFSDSLRAFDEVRSIRGFVRRGVYDQAIKSAQLHKLNTLKSKDDMHEREGGEDGSRPDEMVSARRKTIGL
jgi:glycosyltransferase involved in cell wall biosynthesis